MRRYDPVDEQWAVMAPLLQVQQGNARHCRDRQVILHMLLDSQRQVALARLARTLRAVEDGVQPPQYRTRRGKHLSGSRSVANSRERRPLNGVVETRATS